MAGLLAVRIKDGIFVGNAISSQDEEFLFLNKVSHIINCAATETPNLYQQAGINYLSFPWRDAATTNLFDAEDRNVAQIYQFIEKGLEKGECVLVHSRDGTSRCCAVVVAYLMLKFGWSLTNTLSFMITAHPDMVIQPYFIRQLKTYAKRHELEMDIFSPGVDTSRLPLDNEQWVLKNTYFNSLAYNAEQNADLRKAVMAFEASAGGLGIKKKRRIMFVDTRATTDVVSTTTVPVVPKAPESGRSTPTGPIIARRPTANPHPLVTNWDEVPVQVLSPAARQLLHPTASSPSPAYSAHPHPTSSPASNSPSPGPPPQPLQPMQYPPAASPQPVKLHPPSVAPPAPRPTPQLYPSSPAAPPTTLVPLLQDMPRASAINRFADATAPRPSPRPSLSASDELSVPALSPAARRPGPGDPVSPPATASYAQPAAAATTLGPRVVNNPNMQRLHAAAGGSGLSGDFQHLSLSATSTTASGGGGGGGGLATYTITNRHVAGSAGVPERRPTTSTQQIINPNLLRSGAAPPPAQSAPPATSTVDPAAKRTSRKGPASPFVAQPRKGSPLPRRENRTPAPAGPPTTGPGQRTDARYNNSPLHERERGTYTSSSYTAPTAPGVLRAQYSNSPSRYDSPSRGAYSSDAGESDDGKKGLKKRRPSSNSRPRDSTPTGQRPPGTQHPSPGPPPPSAAAAAAESRLMRPTASFLRKTTR